MSRIRKAVVIVLSVALVASFAVPAFGGPSPLKVAKKALRTAKKANKTAKSAGKRASAAGTTAGQALTNANRALTQASAGGITVVAGRAEAIPPGGVEDSIAGCPTGQKAISGGGHSITANGEEMVASQTNADRSGWFVIGTNTFGSTNGEVQAIALCAPAGKAVAARRGTLARDARRLRQRFERILAQRRR